MNTYKLIMSFLLINFHGLNCSEKPCRNPVRCDFTTAIRKQYANNGILNAPDSWQTPKQEVKSDSIHNEIIALVSCLPFPLTDKDGQPILVTFRENGNPTVEVKNSPDYQSAIKVLEPFDGPRGLDKAQRIMNNNNTLSLNSIYQILRQKYCQDCVNPETKRK